MASSDEAALEAEILAAHECEDIHRLAGLYQRAARLKHDAGDMDAFWFLITHAYVFALEAGHPDAAGLHQLLKAAGRDE